MRIHHIALSIALSLGFSAHAASGHAHEDPHAVKALHGGIVSEAKHLTFELVPQADKVTLHVRDHGKPVSTEGGTAKLNMVSGIIMRSADLTPAGNGQLSAALDHPIAAGSKIVARVQLPGKGTVQVRFSVK